MANTRIATNHALAVKKQSAVLSVASIKNSFFGKGYIGEGEDSKSFIQRVVDLKQEAGDEVGIDLLMPGKGSPIIGDNLLDGNEEELNFYTDKVKIDMVRYGVSKGSKMSQKRTKHDLRKSALKVQAEWWTRCFDEIMFIYAAGTMGNTPGFLWNASSEFFQTNALTAADANHQFYGGVATSAASLAAGEVMTLALVDKMQARAETMGGDATDELSMLPGRVGGEENYCLTMHPYQAQSLRASTSTGSWLDIQKAAVTHEGRDNPIFKGGSYLGMYNGVVLKKHRNVITNKAGAGGSVPAAHALFMGRQGLLFASGQNGNDMSFSVTEEKKDHGAKIAFGSSCIMGVKKATYQTLSGARDFGIFNVLTANPVPV